MPNHELNRKSLNQDGYVRMRGAFSAELMRDLRHDIYDILDSAGAIKRIGLEDYEIIQSLYFDQQPRFRQIYRKIVCLDSLHALLHHPDIVNIGNELLGNGVFFHPVLLPRIVFPTPDKYRWTTLSAHQDYPYVQGTKGFVTFWTPIDNCPLNRGPLALQPRTQTSDVLPVRLAPQGGLECSFDASIPWVVEDMNVGDLIVFGSHVVHSGTQNKSDRIRMSVDFRAQRISEPVCSDSLPSTDYIYGLTVSQVYAKQRPSHKYYWNKLPLDVVKKQIGLSGGTALSLEEMMSLVEKGGDSALPILFRIAEFTADDDARRAAEDILLKRGISDPLQIEIL